MKRWVAALACTLIGCVSAAGDPVDEGTGGAGSGGAPRADAGGGAPGKGGTSTPDAGGYAGAGGSTRLDAGGTGGSPGGVSVSVSPAASAVLVGHTLQLTATVAGTSDTAVTWSVSEPSGCGSVSASGNYSAPATVPDPAYCHVKATSAADTQRSGVAMVTVTASASSGQPGVWENVTPGGFVTNDGVGAQDVVVDPARPSDFYAFAGIGTGVWKSSDYGLSWTMVSTGTLGDVLASGRQWAAAIDPSPLRDPSTPPTLYTANGYGPVQGVFKLTDGGINWVHYEASAPGVNVYSIDVDPYDSRHLIAGLHHTPDVIESTDAGETWAKIPTAGSSIYVWFIDVGDAATTHKTWLAISETDSGGVGLQRTSNGKDWTTVNSLQHAHGSSAIFQADGLLYAAGVFGSNGSGVYRSDDHGVTWVHVSPDSGQNGVFGTSRFLYTYGGGTDPALKTAPRASDTSWTDMAHPAAMTYCTKRAAVSYDGAHNIIVAGNWNAGIWRYVEP